MNKENLITLTTQPNRPRIKGGLYSSASVGGKRMYGLIIFKSIRRR
jgi:hypothetical protein